MNVLKALFTTVYYWYLHTYTGTVINFDDPIYPDREFKVKEFMAWAAVEVGKDKIDWNVEQLLDITYETVVMRYTIWFKEPMSAVHFKLRYGV